MPMESINVVNDEGFSSEVKISSDVVANVAALAATEIEGVDSLSGNVTADIIKKLGIKNMSKGVQVVFGEDGKDVSVSVAITMKYGFSIPETSAQVQERVKSSIESMIGLNVTDVKISVLDVNTK